MSVDAAPTARAAGNANSVDKQLDRCSHRTTTSTDRRESGGAGDGCSTVEEAARRPHHEAGRWFRPDAGADVFAGPWRDDGRRRGDTRGRPPSCVAALARSSTPPSTEPDGNHPQAQPGLTQIRDLNTLVLSEVPRTDLTYGQRIQRCDEPDHDPVAVDLVPACPVCSGRAGHPHLAGCGPHAPPARPQLHELLTLGRLRTTPRPFFTRRNDVNTTSRT